MNHGEIIGICWGLTKHFMAMQWGLAGKSPSNSSMIIPLERFTRPGKHTKNYGKSAFVYR